MTVVERTKTSDAEMVEEAVVQVEDLEHRLRDNTRRDEFVVRLAGRLTIRPRSFVAILGPSGCGKTTLLSVLGLLRRPSDPASIGQFRICVGSSEGVAEQFDVKDLWRRNKQGKIEAIRRRHIGFALQSGELLPSLNVRENIAAPLHLNGVFGRPCTQRVDELLSAFGLASKPDAHGRGRSGELDRARVNRLSGGEYQRVVLARAVAHSPAVVFVDEPTSALNRELARTALRQLKEARGQRGGNEAAMMITHDEVLAGEFADLIVRMAPVKAEMAGEVVEIAENCP